METENRAKVPLPTPVFGVDPRSIGWRRVVGMDGFAGHGHSVYRATECDWRRQTQRGNLLRLSCLDRCVEIAFPKAKESRMLDRVLLVIRVVVIVGSIPAWPYGTR